jgi:hypothetical protein
MLWLIVAGGDCAAEVRAVTETLKKLKAASVVYCAEEAGGGLEGYALAATHAIVLNAEKALGGAEAVFFTGYLAGKKAPLFFTGALPPGLRYSPESHVAVFARAEEMIQAIRRNFPRYVEEEREKTARATLLKECVPFTPDFFAFHIAAGHERHCRLFLAAGMDVNCRDSAGTPMLNMAARHNRRELLEWLLDSGADIDAVSKDRGYTALMDAVWKSNAEIVECLVKKKANLNVISRDGQSVLVLAVGTGNEAVCRLLVENGADPTVKDTMGLSAIEYARLFKKDALAAFLEKYA